MPATFSTAPDDLHERLDRSASRLGIEVEAVDAAFGEVEAAVRSCGPALWRLPGPDGPRLLAVLRCRAGRLRIVAPDGRLQHLRAGDLALELQAPLAATAGPAVDRLLDRAGVIGLRRAAARGALLAERLRQVRVGGCWMLRLPPGASFLAQMRQEGLLIHLLQFLLGYAAGFALLLLSWWPLGIAVLQRGHLDPSALGAWALLLLSAVPFAMLSQAGRAKLAIGLGSLLKRRLLAGALALEPEEIRHQGSGQLLGRVIESEAVETLALNGGFLTVAGLVDTALAGGVLALGAGGAWQAALLGLWVLVTLGIAVRLLRARGRWTERRLDMTHDLIERLVGHRTRLAQEARERWHDAEDAALEASTGAALRFDRSKAVLLSLAPRGWLLLGIAGLLPALISGGSSPAALAVAVGGTLAAWRGLSKSAEGFSHLSGALLSWRYAAGLFRAAARSRPRAAALEPPRSLPATPGSAEPAPVVLEAVDLAYRHGGRGRSVLQGCTLRVQAGDRILLEGASGSGKSTLAAVLTGLREPESGLVLLGGLDRATVGSETWRRRVVLAPQFHENHVFTETFAFNLLLGRRWPPTDEDLAEAVDVCQNLGLGDLLARMPSGLHQIVGETGWQLSHGERSRLYMARALLQNGDVVLLDESFAALDPASLHQALDGALRRVSTLVVIAHP